MPPNNMTSTPQTPETNDGQSEIDWLSSTDLTELDALFDEFAPDIVELSSQEPSPQIQAATELTQELPPENRQLSVDAPLFRADESASMSQPARPTVEQSSEPLSQTNWEIFVEMGGDVVSEPKSGSEEESQMLMGQVQLLRHKLQKGILTKNQPVKASEMKDMSLFLQKLEKLEIPEAVLRETKLRRLLERILAQREIPMDAELKFTERATNLFNRYNAILFPKDRLSTSLAAQQINACNMEPNGVPDIQQHVNSLNRQHPAEISTAQQIKLEAHTVPDSQLNFGVPSDSHLSKATSKPLCIDLTGEDEPETNIGSGPAAQKTSSKAVAGSPIRSIQTKPPSPSTALDSCGAIHKDQNPTHAAPPFQKRKRADSIPSSPLVALPSGDPSPLHLNISSNSAVAVATSPDRKTPTRRGAMKKTTVQEYMGYESLWMKGSLEMVEELFKLSEEEAELSHTVKELNDKVKELNDTAKDLHMKMKDLNGKGDELAARKKTKLTDFKRSLLIWVAEDKKVTEEWENSE